ncbi:LOW QUALITY PROTEIN: BTB/POZ domain-containing protein At2g13690-like [Primulina tabacum]|uniref:LOW QUALITY PROTEIN: BTB/POZ domain-containing protein At2g13690-like n=1 Tax=Primulina tabacum TaxID=48773 RepID=UPI003F5A073C
MNDTTRLKSKPNHRRRRFRWCCSFSTPLLSPENPTEFRSHSSKKMELNSNSPQKLPLARRILSPGRVSPIPDDTSIFHATPKERTPLKPPTPAQKEGNMGIFYVRLSLEGRNGESLILELDSEILATNSSIFADLIADYRKNLRGGICKIEVPDVENLNVFRETIELMLEVDIQKKLLKIGVLRAIDLLEVSAGIMFARGVSSCLKYLEAVPWTEEEEEKLRNVLNSLNLDAAATAKVLDRLFSHVSVDSQQTLTKYLILSITTCTNANARNELKALVKALLCKSSVYEKDSLELNKQDIFAICESCLVSLVSLLEEASKNDTDQKPAKKDKDDKPLLERISKQVDNINWLLDILLDHLMAEEFVDLWASQRVLHKMHENASPMVRYELSRVSATLFIAMGNRKLHCRSETRLTLIQVWFRPMLSDFGWLQRCRKGLDMKALEEAMGQALLTLPLKQQNVLFMEWFGCFSKCGMECPNLSKAFQIWWRRSFIHGLGTLGKHSCSHFVKTLVKPFWPFLNAVRVWKVVV